MSQNNEFEPTPLNENENENGLPIIDWEAASENARLGDYEPAHWVRNFRELPELENIPEPADPCDVFLIHWRARMAREPRLEKILKLPLSGEISANLSFRKYATGGPIGLILEPARSAITEMHVADVNSTPGHEREGLPEGARKAANPCDRLILRQLQRLGRLTPTQVAVLEHDGTNEVFVEVSRIARVLGIIYNVRALHDILSEVRSQARDLNLPIFRIDREGRIIKEENE